MLNLVSVCYTQTVCIAGLKSCLWNVWGMQIRFRGDLECALLLTQQVCSCSANVTLKGNKVCAIVFKCVHNKLVCQVTSQSYFSLLKMNKMMWFWTWSLFFSSVCCRKALSSVSTAFWTLLTVSELFCPIAPLHPVAFLNTVVNLVNPLPKTVNTKLLQ